ncbi:hypothetical protein IWQ49_003916 [Labrenzia sp. EL_126]|nr:hypothetical protein [Labrenzia sp. EL_126]
MFSKLTSALMATVLVSTHFALGLSAHADVQSFEEAEQRFQNVEEFFLELKSRYENEDPFRTAGPGILNTWDSNWRLYDKKRPSQGEELDQLHTQLHQLRDQIGVSAALLVHYKNQIALAEKERQAVKFGDGVAPNDAADVTSDVRDAKQAVLSSRLKNLRKEADNLKIGLESQKVLYAAVFGELNEVTRPVNIFQPKPEEISRVLQTTLAGTGGPSGTTSSPLQEDVAIAREFLNEKSFQYLEELLQNAPVQVLSLRTEHENAPWYDASWRPSDRAAPIHSQIDPDRLQEAYKSSGEELEKEIEALEEEIASLSDVIVELGQGWSKAADIVFSRENTITQSKVYLSVANASVEVVAAASAFLASGGLSVAATPQYLGLLADAADDQIVAVAKPVIGSASTESLKALIRRTSRHARDLAAIMIDESASVSNLNVSKTAERLATGIFTRYKHRIRTQAKDTVLHTALVVGPTKKFLTDATEDGFGPSSFIFAKDSRSLEETFGKERYAEFLTVAPIVVNDVVESVVTNGGLKEFKDSYAFTKAVATRTTSKLSADAAKGAAGAGVAVLSTFLKVGNQMVYNRLEAIWNKEKARAAAQAGVYKQRYYELVVARTLLEDDLIFKKRLLDSFKALAEFGVTHQELDVNAEPLPREEFDKIGRWQVVATLSRPVLYPPVFSAAGVQFEKAVPYSGKPGAAAQVWKTSAINLNVPADAREITLEISLNDDETPYDALDADPSTPLQLTSIDRLSWTGFEADHPDRQHKLPLRSDVPCDLSRTAGGGIDANATYALGGRSAPGTARSCDLWVQLYEARSCDYTTEHAASSLLAGDSVGYWHDGKTVSWGMCLIYNPITKECLDGKVERGPSDMCLDAKGEFLLDERNSPYSKFANDRQRPVWHNINHSSCQGQNDITLCPKTYKDPRTGGQGGADLPVTVLHMLDLNFQQQQQKIERDRFLELEAQSAN